MDEFDDLPEETRAHPSQDLLARTFHWLALFCGIGFLGIAIAEMRP